MSGVIRGDLQDSSGYSRARVKRLLARPTCFV